VSLRSSYKIAIPADGRGYTHRLCPDCEIKFGIRSIDTDFPENIYCPYCDRTGRLPEFNVPEQFEYATQEGLRQIKYDVMQELQNSMASAFRGSSRSKHVKVSFKPAVLRHEPVPILIQSEIPTDMVCSSCQGLYEIYGIASKCPFCGNDDIKIMEANLTLIYKELDSDRALRHIYNDLVIAFQNVCRFYALDDDATNFQNIKLAERYFKDNFRINLLDGIEGTSLDDMRTAFEKRHKEQHTGGIIDQKYVDVLGLENGLIGQKVSYAKDELTSAFKALVVINNNLRNNITK
jgi:hypothetical protein